MFSRRVPFLAVSALIFFMLALSQTTYGLDATNENILLTVFQDGAADVEYNAAADPNAPRKTLTLIGNSHDNLLVTGHDGSPLDFSLDRNVLTVDTLGESSVTITYTSRELATLSGALWTIILNSPTSATIVLPQGTTIISVGQPPIAINECDTSPYYRCATTLTMPAGNNEISYILAVKAGDSSISSPSSQSNNRPSSTRGAGLDSLLQQQGYLPLVLVLVGVAAVVGGVAVWKKRRKGQ